MRTSASLRFTTSSNKLPLAKGMSNLRRSFSQRCGRGFGRKGAEVGWSVMICGRKMLLKGLEDPIL